MPAKPAVAFGPNDVFSSAASLPPESEASSNAGSSRMSTRLRAPATSIQVNLDAAEDSSSSSSGSDSQDASYEQPDMPGPSHQSSEEDSYEVFQDKPLYDGTPVRNTDTSRKLDRGVKESIIAFASALGTGRRCLVTLAFGLVQFAHIVARSTRGDARLKLEYHWGMFAKTLNWDTARNIILLAPTIHFGMDHLIWLLLPLPDVARKILKYYNENNNNEAKTADKGYFKKLFPDSATGWQYLFLDVNCQPDESIHRLIISPEEAVQTRNKWTPPRLQPKAYETHSTPFENLTVISHCHPFFVVAHAGKMLRRFRKALRDDDAYAARWDEFPEQISESATLVESIWDLWDEKIPDLFTDPQRNRPSATDDSGRPKPNERFPDRDRDGYLVPSVASQNTPSKASNRSRASNVLLPRLEATSMGKEKGKEKEITTPPRHKLGFGSMGPPPEPTSSRGNASASSSNKRKPAFSPPSALQKQHREAPSTPKRPNRKPSPKVSEPSSSDSPQPSQVSANGNPRRLPAPSANIPGLTTYGRRAPGQPRTSTSDRSQRSSRGKPEWRL
ncbi:hypothetical protein C8J56DRAFT_1158260 [Mycena floridula]|nr:hypothetical protein C8J56DRAFT_1158260 [Mycena floridula]